MGATSPPPANTDFSSVEAEQGSDVDLTDDLFYYSRHLSLLYDDDPDHFLRLVVPRFGPDLEACALKLLKTYQGLSWFGLIILQF